MVVLGLQCYMQIMVSDDRDIEQTFRQAQVSLSGQDSMFS